jgi:cytochrome b subunit of formate dehydrogenase
MSKPAGYWIRVFACFAVALTLGLAGPLHAAPGGAYNPNPVVSEGLDNASCLTCHGDDADEIEVTDADDEERLLEAIDPHLFEAGVHAQLDCIACHTYIVDSQEEHQKLEPATKPDCATCHTEIWETARQEAKLSEKPRLTVVMDNIRSYHESFHARPNPDNPDVANATCHECHNTHGFNVPPAGTEERKEWRLSTPLMCGSCHDFSLEEYEESVHGHLVLQEGNADAAVCIDCHTSHDIGGTSSSPVRLAITDQCGTCHEENYRTYRRSYHGKVATLGYAYTAKCYDCHGSHGVLRVDDPDSMVHADHRLETCQTCHDERRPGMRTATAGFISFQPHAHAGDFERYPQVWIVTRFMIALLIGVFAFFWVHSGLWYYREWKERKEGRIVTYIRTDDLIADHAKHVQRFPLGWRIAHLVFALVTMTLVFTGITPMFAETGWAPAVARFFDGPQTLGLIHRVAATLFLGIFLIHFVYMMQKLLRDKDFRWFGPDSLVPNWKDLSDIIGMFKWFFGKGPKPLFDRWTYFEKFDYWAVFWGVSIIGVSGLMLAFPHITATYLPGWVFNVATVVHGEEAFLAAVFLFTVHFFNNHFRPEKMPPPDIVMFTGSQSLEEFSHDHPAQYRRLVDSGELEKYLVQAPSAPMRLGSKILGIVLILIGLTLLTLVGIGFFVVMI